MLEADESETGEEGFIPQMLYLYGKIPFDTMIDTTEEFSATYCYSFLLISIL